MMSAKMINKDKIKGAYEVPEKLDLTTVDDLFKLIKNLPKGTPLIFIDEDTGAQILFASAKILNGAIVIEYEYSDLKRGD